METKKILDACCGSKMFWFDKENPKVLLIEIFPNKDMVRISFDKNIFATITSANKLNQLARNDGFRDWEEMKEWFTEDFTGKLVIWKDFEAIK